MKFFIKDIKRVMGAMVYANRATNLRELNRLLEQEEIRPAGENKKQNAGREHTAAFVPKVRHLRLVD